MDSGAENLQAKHMDDSALTNTARPRRPQPNRMEPPMNADERRYGPEPKVPVGVNRRVSAAEIRTEWNRG